LLNYYLNLSKVSMSCGLMDLIDFATPILPVAARLAGASVFCWVMSRNCSARLSPSEPMEHCKSGPYTPFPDHRFLLSSIYALRMSFICGSSGYIA
jgi:hypothetical protein